MTDEEINKVASPYRWRSLICIMSLECLDEVYRHLGCPISDKMTLQLIATETVKAHVGAFRGRAGESYFKMTNGFLDEVE